MTRDMSQWEVVLRMLRSAGARGVHTHEIRREMIANPSERIAELERRGHSIRTGDRERLNGKAFGVRYFLVSSPAGVERDADHSPEPCAPTSGLTGVSIPLSTSLFEVDSESTNQLSDNQRRWSFMDVDDEAAA